MDIAVPSRFACLKIEDDDRPGNVQIRKTQEKTQCKKYKEVTKSSFTATRKKTGPVEKAKTPSAKKHKQKQRTEQEKDWEEWQKKDAEMIDDAFEEDMQHAILESKLEFEQQKKHVKSEPQLTRGKKKKTQTMSWDQFVESKDGEIKEESKIKDSEKNFFTELNATAKKEIIKEKVEEGRKKRQEKFDETVSLAQLQVKLEEERQKNVVLEKKLKEAIKEISIVKKRNTILCSLLGQGEMKEKAQVLADFERLQAVKQDLTEEVAKLHKLLEQERSNKQSANINEQHSKHNKDKKKKIK